MLILNIVVAEYYLGAEAEFEKCIEKRYLSSNLEAEYHLRAEAEFWKIYREALFKPRKQVYISKRYLNQFLYLVCLDSVIVVVGC